MKKAISFILICTYLTAVFQFAVPYLSYFANYSYFSTEACIHKDEPSHVCDGQCQLKKMVKQHDHASSASDHSILTDRVSSSTIFFHKENDSYHFSTSALPNFQTNRQQMHTQFISELPAPPPKLG